MRKIKEYYNKNRNFICTIFYMLLSGYVGMIEITLESKPIAGIVIFMIGFHFMKNFFVHEVWEKKELKKLRKGRIYGIIKE